MNFVLSKLFWICFPPLNLTVLLLAGGFFVRMKWFRTGRAMLGLGLAVFVFSGVLPTGMFLLRGLESKYAAPPSLPKNISGILVLGGSFDVENVGGAPCDGILRFGRTGDRGRASDAPLPENHAAVQWRQWHAE